MTMGKSKNPAVEEAAKLATHDAVDRVAAWVRANPMTGAELRARIDTLGVSYVQAARWLGLTVDGLHKQMRGARAVSTQTALLYWLIEKELVATTQILLKEYGATEEITSSTRHNTTAVND
jgi:hypothetical protein